MDAASIMEQGRDDVVCPVQAIVAAGGDESTIAVFARYLDDLRWEDYGRWETGRAAIALRGAAG